MEEGVMAFLIWAIVGGLFIVMGIICLKTKKARIFGFWANAEVIQVEDVKGYKGDTAYRFFVLKRKLMLYRYGIHVKET